MNLIQIKRAVRANKVFGRFADRAYLTLTGQLKEERHCKAGHTPYYIIRPPKSNVGLIGLYNDVIGKMGYALEKGYRPVVDFKNYPTVYSGEKHNGNGNVWEWFFKQPFNNSLEDAYKDDYILSPMAGSNISVQQLKWCSQIAKNIELSDEVKSYIYIYIYNGGFKNGKNILGVFCRGTDFTQCRPVGHPIQPDRETLIKMTEEHLNQWDCDRIFLTTEEKESVDAFNEAFPGKVLTVKQELVENFSIERGMLIEDFRTANGTNHYSSGLGYLTSVVMLSQCDCFLGAIAGGSLGALIMNDFKYREKEIIDLGVYT